MSDIDDPFFSVRVLADRDPDHAFEGWAIESAANLARQLLRSLSRLEDAAGRVVNNQFGAKPRHSRSLLAPFYPTGCADDCIPCGVSALASVLGVRDPYAKRTASAL
jgi:hypothetical protein